MSFTYENQGTVTYLVYELEEDDVIDTMSLGMLTNNHINGLAPTNILQMNEQQFLRYNISAKISVMQFFEGTVNKRRLLGVFGGIADAILSADEYMIEVDSILLDLNYIFTDVSSCETKIICLPLLNRKQNGWDLKEFFKETIFRTKVDQTEDCDYIARIINFLNSAQGFSTLEFKHLIDELSGRRIPVMSEGHQERAAVSTNVQTTVSTEADRNASKTGAAIPKHQGNVMPISGNPGSGMPVPGNPGSGMPVSGNGMAIPGNQGNGMAIPRNQGNGMAIPGNPGNGMPQAKMNTAESGGSGQEKPISMYYLLSHFSKENMEIYKKQRNKNKQNVNQQQMNSPVFPNSPLPEQAVQPSVMQRQPQEQIPATGNSNSMQTPPVNVGMESPISSNTSPSVNFGETVDLSAMKIGQTMPLKEEMLQERNVSPHLIRMKNNEKIIINKPMFKIGKEKSYVDYFIGDNTAISRSHANILQRNGNYFVVDTNSTNHTYLNGAMIQSNVETKLSHGMKVRLANEEFEFRMY